MRILYNGDCLEEMKTIDDKSVDLIFCDLPYGQTACNWDCIIDIDKLWIQFMRIKKLNTPLIFTCTTKFGLTLLNSCPKKCPFRYDMVWCKSTTSGFLCSGKMPLRKHEMIYVFYEKLPFYDLSSHKHKFKKEYNEYDNKDGAYGVIKSQKGHPEPLYNPPLPTSLIKEDKHTLYGDIKEKGIPHTTTYDPPLPTSLIKEGLDSKIYGTKERKSPLKQMGSATGNQGYDPPLPTSLIKEEEGNNIKRPDYKTESDIYGDIKREDFIRKNGESMYEPPLPNSLLEIKSTRGKHSTQKPVELMKWILKYYSKEGDVVFDPTMGSGSMGVACKEMNRQFIGIEKDKEIFDSAKKIIDN
jgi:hypothetical protein